MSDSLPPGIRERLAGIQDFEALLEYLRDELDWPIEADSIEDLTFSYDPDELGIDPDNAAKIKSIRRLRPLAIDQPWGIFFVEFERKRLPVVALRRILGSVAVKKRASANSVERQAWEADDLLFVSNYGEGDERTISFAHFTPSEQASDLPTLKVLGWDSQDTRLHIDDVAEQLHNRLAWPEDESDLKAWRENWRAAFRLRHRETITTAKALSIRLAELARGIRDRIRAALEIESESGPLNRLLTAFRESLVGDLDEKGFADMYAQTIAYGLLSARIVDPAHRTTEDFAAHMRTSPFLRELMEEFIRVGGRRRGKGGAGIDFDELGVSEVVELLDDANMEAVVRDFGRQNQQEDPVIHFYEDFLSEYDKKERVSRGVFYTPRPVVSYIVRSVNELLRSEFGLADGLADTTTWGEMAERHVDLKIPEGTSPDQACVQILDPATGTGTFLVEVIEIVHATMRDKWKGEGVRSERALTQRWNEYVPKHLLPRLHGYELMMAPYAIAHLKVGLKLYETGYRFESEERARIYLTNALEPAQDHSGKLEFAIPALAHEAEAVSGIKAKQRFSVILGNPPYKGISANMGEWIDDLLHGRLDGEAGGRSYYKCDGEPLGEKKLWLQDDYVKFIRLSQWLLDSAGAGVHGYVTNHGFLDNPTFRGMRWSLMESFDRLKLLDLHGNIKKREKSPDGFPDANVFAIGQGVAISVFVSRPVGEGPGRKPVVQHADLWGEKSSKLTWLGERSGNDTDWSELEPDSPFHLFVPYDQSEVGEYWSWAAVNKIFPVNVTGIVTARDAFVIDFDRGALQDRIADFRSEELSDQAIREKFFSGKGSAKYPPGDSRGWKVPEARRKVREDEQWSERYAPLLYRPFDIRDIYYVPWMVDWPRTEAMPHMLAGENLAIGTTRTVEIGAGFSHIFATREMIQHHTISIKEVNYELPLYLYPGVGKSDGSLFHAWPEGAGGRRPNLDPDFVEDLDQATGLTFVSDGRADLAAQFGSEDVLAYIYAVFHSPEYRRRFEPMLKLDFPRVPPPGSAASFGALAQLGHDLLALHLLESRTLDNPIACYNGPSEPEVERVSRTDQTVWLDGAETCGFEGVSDEVWNFHIGGYKVCEKWLKDRQAKGGKNPRPGRTLTDEDIAHYQKIIVAISETIRIMGEIDEVIDQHGGWPDAFATGADGQEDKP